MKSRFEEEDDISTLRQGVTGQSPDSKDQRKLALQRIIGKVRNNKEASEILGLTDVNLK